MDKDITPQKHDVYEKEKSKLLKQDSEQTLNNKSSLYANEKIENNQLFAQKKQENESSNLKDDHKSKTSCFKNILRNITVEPIQALFIIPSVMGHLATQKLNLDKACRVNLNFSQDICEALKNNHTENYTYYETEVQKLTVSMIPYKSVIMTVFPCIMVLFMGSWSDRTGRRKICMILPIAGEALMCLNNLLNVYFFYELPLQFLIISDAVFPALGGGWVMMYLGVFSYISDVTKPKNRTFRMGLVNFCMTVSLPIGMGLSGVFLKAYGYYGVFCAAFMLDSLVLMYAIYILKDPPRSLEQRSHDGKGLAHFLKTFFNPKNVQETIRVVFKNGPNRRRLRVCVLLVVVAILFGPIFGEMSILYLSTRFRFQWDEVKFSMFATYNFITHTIGTMFSITVFSKCLKWPDAVLGIISTTSKIFGSYFYCFARTGLEFYLAPLAEILNGTSLLALRSIISKLVAADELGKVNSIFGLAENLMPLVYVPLYTQVYKATMTTLPGAVFLMGAGLTVPALIVFIWLLVEHIRNRMKDTTTIEKNPEALST